MLTRIRNYPARLQAVVVAAVALGTAFQLDWTGEQTGAVAAFSSALIALFLEKPGSAKA